MCGQPIQTYIYEVLEEPSTIVLGSGSVQMCQLYHKDNWNITGDKSFVNVKRKTTVKL